MMITHEVSAEEVLRLFKSAWWTASRDLDGVSRMLSQSDVTFGLRVDGTLEGFARVLSDEVYLALILDVIVSPSRRGEGLGAECRIWLPRSGVEAAICRIWRDKRS